MAKITIKGNPITLKGELPKVGALAPDFTATKGDLSDIRLSDFRGKKVVLNLFPSIDTGVCAQSVRTFNQSAAGKANTVVLCISKDLPFALSRFCGAEGIENVTTLSLFRSEDFNLGLEMVEGPLKGLLARAVIVLDEEGLVRYAELVSELTTEPNYDAALKSL